MASLESTWLRNETKWKKQFPLCPHNPSLGSWLFVRKTSRGAGLGCKACYLASVESQYGHCSLITSRQLSVDRFCKHTETEIHLQSVEMPLRMKASNRCWTTGEMEALFARRDTAKRRRAFSTVLAKLSVTNSGMSCTGARISSRMLTAKVGE